MGSYRICMCFTRKFRITEAEPPLEVKEEFNKHSEGGSHMTAEQLRRFLVDAQGESGATIYDAERIIEQVLQKRHHMTKFTRHTLTLDDFHQDHHYLFTVDFNPPIRSQVRHDMNAPLSHYFIHTGHNSYLTGNRLSSDSSDVPIIKALKRGVRVIELDNGQIPQKMMSMFYMEDDHLTPDLQDKVAQMVTQTFGRMLFYPKSECLIEFPSPEELKFRIIISTKPPEKYVEAKSFIENNSQKGKDSDEDVWGEEPSVLIAHQEGNDKSDNDSDKSDHYQDDEDNDDCDKNLHSADPPAYKRLIAIDAGKPKSGLKKPLKVKIDKVRRPSLSEQRLEKAAKSHGKDLVRFTQKNFLWVYPKGIRFNSSNYKPLIGWMHGAQMVAFNMQGYGRSLWLMHGMFRSNGGCGYVRKPDFFMNTGPNNDVFDPKVMLPVKKILKVKVYIGDGWHLDFKHTHFDSYSPPDFYTRVGIAAVPNDETMKKTKIIEDNWTPVWDEEFTFPLTVPELALLRIEVHEYDMSENDDFAGQTCLPVSELREGIRTVPVFYHKGVKFNSVRLLLRFQFV